MQKTRSILFLKDVIEQLDQEDSAEIGRSIGFREKDLDKMIQQCRTKYATFTNLQLEKQRLNRKILELKQQLCEINPQALEQIQRDCQKNGNSEQILLSRQKIIPINKNIKKKNERKRKKRERIYYD